MKNRIYILFVIIIIAAIGCGYVGYLFSEYQHKESEVLHSLQTIKDVNDSFPKKNNSNLSNIIKDQKITIDSLLKIKKENVNVAATSGFSMDGKSISAEELLKYVNELYKEKQYYKTMFEELQKRYNIKVDKTNSDSYHVVVNNPEYNSLVDKYNLLVESKNNLADRYDALVEENNKNKFEINRMKIALDLIKRRYNIEYNVTKKNDSVNEISVDKVKRKRK